MLILANLKSEPEKIDIGCEYRILLDNLDPVITHMDGTRSQTQHSIRLQAWQGVLLELIHPAFEKKHKIG